jgi:acetyl-CoA carboxylase biotin carboxyl carrier protein
VNPKDKDSSPPVVKQAKELVQLLMESASVRRVSLGAGKMKIDLERVFLGGAPLSAPQGDASGGAQPAAPPDTRQKVLSPLVGVFHSQEKPGGKKLAEVGSRVERGQAVGVIEVMGLRNPVTAEAAGVVAEVLVADGQRVQFDQPLLVLETASS